MSESQKHDARDPRSSSLAARSHIVESRAAWKPPTLLELPPLTELTLATGFVGPISFREQRDERDSLV